MSKTTSALVALGVVAGLGVASLPLSTYADGTPKQTDVGVTLKIDDTLTIEADKDNADNKVDLTDGSTTGAVAVKVVTNNQTGYKLNLKGSAGTNPTSLTSGNGDQIKAATAAFTAPAALAATASDSYWGYSVANTNANLSTESAANIAKYTGTVYAGVSESGDEIVNVTKPTGTAGDTTTVTFAAALKDGQPAGTYNGQVTFTATNNVIGG